ncbi:MAG TPA: adenylate/guanylate cyclase domain-containing protein, partial [Mycoplana sp.]|nr:adenylate/guanylate cyclase domain-containing protein [Mycoplana sp.]
SDMALLEAGTLALKGRRSRTRIFAVVGDERLAASDAFADLRSVHDGLVKALRARSGAARQLVREAKAKSARLTEALPEFYRRMSRRSDHFQDIEAEKDVSVK